MNHLCRPAHEVIMQHLEELVVLIEQYKARDTLDVAFARYSQMHALLMVLEEMVIPAPAIEQMLIDLSAMSSRLAGALSTAPAFHARVDRVLAILTDRKLRGQPATVTKPTAEKDAATPTQEIGDGRVSEDEEDVD